MGPEEPEADDDPPVATGRARRGLGLIVIALLVIAFTAVAYLRPSLGSAATPAPPAPASYQLAAVDFVNPDTGWFAGTFNSARFALMHTTDAGNHWARQLSGDVGNAGLYVNFFDSTD